MQILHARTRTPGACWAQGKLGDFVMLDMSKLEVKLLREQQRLMEIEQQALMAQVRHGRRRGDAARACGVDVVHCKQARGSVPHTHRPASVVLIAAHLCALSRACEPVLTCAPPRVRVCAQWAAPTRGASIARDVLEAQMAPSRSNSLAPTSRHGGASQRGGGAASRPQSTHGGAQYDDTAAWQDNAYSSAEDPHGYGGEEWHLPPLGGGGSAPASPGGGGGDEQRQPARPDIINSRSRRLVELVQQGQARMRPVGMYTGTGGAMASDGDAPPPPGNQGGGGDKGGLQQRQSVVFFGRGLGGRDSYGTSEQLSSATPSMRRASYARNSSPSFSDEVPMLPSAVGPFASSATQRQLQMNRQLSMNSLKVCVSLCLCCPRAEWLAACGARRELQGAAAAAVCTHVVARDVCVRVAGAGVGAGGAGAHHAGPCRAAAAAGERGKRAPSASHTSAQNQS